MEELRGRLRASYETRTQLNVVKAVALVPEPDVLVSARQVQKQVQIMPMGLPPVSEGRQGRLVWPEEEAFLIRMGVRADAGQPVHRPGPCGGFMDLVKKPLPFLARHHGPPVFRLFPNVFVQGQLP